jgi:opacity protein-like surface antigen
MLRRVTVLAALALASTAGATHAQGLSFGTGKWYVKGFGGATWPSGDDGDISGVGAGLSARGDADYDTGYTLGAAIGAYFTPNFAMELEYAYRNADADTDVTVTDSAGNIVSDDTIGGDAHSNAVMLNALYYFNGMGPNGAWIPYVGGGLGWANAEIDIDGTFERENALAYQLIGGVGFAVTPSWTLLGEVRWFATDSGDWGGPDGTSWDASFETFDLLVGATYSF